MLHITAATFMLTWKVFFSSWLKRWDDQKRGIDALRRCFKPLKAEPTITLNVAAFNALVVVLLRVVGFSADFRRWAMLWHVLPCLMGSWAFLQKKHGSRMWAVTPAVALCWLHNWCAMLGVGLVSLSMSLLIYVAGLGVEPLLPTALRCSFSFPLRVFELSLQHAVYFMMSTLFALLLTLPLWVRGYRLGMEAVGRRVSISYAEIALELVYQASHGTAFLFFAVPCALLYEILGAPLHVVHFLMFGVELVFINFVTQYKFCIIHQLMHDIQPLYVMAHVEHHICKTIHPVSSAVGLWEPLVEGGGPLFGGVGLNACPYFSLQLVYTGANLVTHTMWPAKCLVQWHTLHHVALADLYNVNIPSARDEEHSEYFAKFNEPLKAQSPFVRIEWLSDVTAFVFAAAAGVFAHYALGVGIAQVWGSAVWAAA